MIKEGIYLNAIYQHYKGGFYRTQNVGYSESTGEPLVIYNACDENGIYKSIREYDEDEVESIVSQPFIRSLHEFTIKISTDTQRFTFIKEL